MVPDSRFTDIVNVRLLDFPALQSTALCFHVVNSIYNLRSTLTTGVERLGKATEAIGRLRLPTRSLSPPRLAQPIPQTEP